MGSVATLALALTGAAPAEARRGGLWLLTQQGVGVDWQARFLLWLQRMRGERPAVELDTQLKGWAWAAGSFSWVEPTSLGLLALRSLARDPVLGHSPERTYRLQQGERLLADRMVPSGGWNYGNSRVLGEELEPYPDTTAWALLALRDSAVGGPALRAMVEPGFAALERLTRENASPLACALAVLARRAHGRDARGLVDALAALCDASGPPGDARTRALAFLALSASPFPYVGGRGA